VTPYSAASSSPPSSWLPSARACTRPVIRPCSFACWRPVVRGCAVASTCTTKSRSVRSPSRRAPRPHPASHAFDRARYAAKVFTVTNERFEELAAEALAALPKSLADVMENVALIVEDEAVGRSLFGLYEGVPLTK